jgi:hypothetical protein
LLTAVIDQDELPASIDELRESGCTIAAGDRRADVISIEFD